MVVSRRSLLVAGAVFPVSAYAQCVTDAPEAASTNLIRYSGDVSNATVWNASAATVTANQATAPDGTMTATRVALIAVSGAAFTMTGQGFNATAAPYAMSIWLKGNVGGERLYLCSTPDGVTYYRTQVILTTAWQRFSLTTGNLTAVLWYFEIGTDLRDTSQTPTAAQTVFMWGGQVELGSYATSYIPTTSAPVGRAIGPTIMSPTQKCGRVTI